MKTIKKGFTLVELLISIAILAVISVGIIQGSILLSKNVNKTRNCVRARQELSKFIQGAYSFSNKSYGAYFYDVDLSFSTNNYFDYLAYYNTVPAGHEIFDSLFFMKNSTAQDVSNDGVMIYDGTDHTISWVRISGGGSVVMLTGVYRIDYIDDSNQGNDPIFRLPHRLNLYNTDYTPDVPKLVVLEFRKEIREPSSQHPQRLTIPVKLMLQLDTTN